MLTKGAIGNLVNRYKAVLKKCNLINTFGTLAVASMLVLGGAGVAEAVEKTITEDTTYTDAFNKSNGAGENVQISGTGEETISFIGNDNPVSDQRPNVSIGGYRTSSSIKNIKDIIAYKNWYNFFNANSATATEPSVLEIDVKGDIKTAKDAVISYFAHATGGTVSIKAENMIVSTGDLRAQSCNTIDGILDIDIRNNLIVNENGGIYAFNMQASNEDTVSKINLHAKNITIDNGSGVCAYTFNGEASGEILINITADETLSISASEDYAVKSFKRDDSATGNISKKINLQGKNIILNSNVGAILSSVNSDVTIGDNEGFVSATINGDISVEKSSSTKVNLGTNGSLTGAISTDDTSTTSLGVGTDSNWNATGDSNVTNLALDGGNVNIAAGVDIAAANATGNGNINMEDAEELGSFTAADGDASVNVQATDADGNVKNADEVSADTLKKMKAKVSGLDNVTASAPEGDVNGALTIAADGTVTESRNTLMDAALQQASIATVSLDRILTNDVRKRLGDIRSDANTTGVWMRWDGGKLKGDGGLTNNFNTIQIGGDTKVAKNCRLGVAGSFTHGDTEFARGTGELEGFSFAAYATWMGENGMFADVVARLGHFSTEMQVEGRTGDIDSRVASLSGEYGWRFNLCDQFFIEPQVELAYTYVSSDDMTLGDAKYSFDSVDSLTGRAGLVAGWNLPDNRGNVYARASIVQQFMGDARISGMKGDIRSIQELDGNDTWLEYGIGANVKLTDKTYLWADVERTEGAKIDEEWRGTVGIRYSF